MGGGGGWERGRERERECVIEGQIEGAKGGLDAGDRVGRNWLGERVGVMRVKVVWGGVGWCRWGSGVGGEWARFGGVLGG